MKKIVKMFNSMNDYYDILNDLRYSWFFSRLHYLISKFVILNNNPYDVLDIGCGTGFQSFLHAAAGSRVIGFDIANELIDRANKKLDTFSEKEIVLFPGFFNYVKRYNYLIKKNVTLARANREYQSPQFKVANATNCPFDDARFDHVNCCGSVLSFVKEYKKVFEEISRVLRPNGTFFIEVENKWNFNTFWSIIDPLLNGKFGLNKNFQKVWEFFMNSPISNQWFEFPFWGDLNLFNRYQLKRDLLEYGLIIKKKWSIHSITSVIPNIYLEMKNPPKLLIRWFNFLSKIEENIPFYVPGCSIVIYGKKNQNF